jgi:hypothetical protein
MKLSLLHPRILLSVCSAIPQLPCYPIDPCILWKQPLKNIFILLSGNYVNRTAYYRIIYELGEAYQRNERFQEAEYCSGMLKEERVENGKM